MLQDFRAAASSGLTVFSSGTDHLSDDSVRSVVDASSAVIRMVQNRPLFAAVLAGSFALHLFALLLIVLLESVPTAKPVAAVEIPIELVSAAQADHGGVTGSSGGKAEAAQARGTQNGQQQGAKPAAKPVQQEQAAKAESKPAQAEPKPSQVAAAQKPPPAPALKTAENKPSPPVKPPPPNPEPPKSEPPKQAASQPPQKPPANPPAPRQVATAQKPGQSEPAKPSAQVASAPAAQAPAVQTPPPQHATAPMAPPPTLAALPPPESPSPEVGGRSPLGLMQDDWRAVAVPKPSADGDEQLSYKTVVFGMLELNKRFPEDARARGASGSSTIYFELNDDGSVKTVKLLESSGDTSLDVESLAIVMRSSPFPKPPRGAQKIFAATIEFNPNDR